MEEALFKCQKSSLHSISSENCCWNLKKNQYNKKKA